MSLAFEASAKRFANQYTEFELPPGWSCAQEGAEWVCQAENEERRKEAIIILAAKYKGPQDSNEQYKAYLDQAKSYKLPGGRTQVSEPKFSKEENINGHPWIDALHLASEVPGFYTRYLATVKEGLGVAVTFSVAKNLYGSYQEVFDRVVKSLRVFAPKNMDNVHVPTKGQEGSLVANIGGNLPARLGGGDGTQQAPKAKSEDNTNLFILLFILAGAAIVIAKSKKGKKDKNKKS